MSGFDSLLERLREAYAAITEAEVAAAAAPADRYVLANLASLKRHAAQLEEAWEKESQARQLEVCRYRLVATAREDYSLKTVASSLLDFQELFTQVYDAIVNGPKHRARVSSGISQETAFNFGFSYPGSLGVAIYMQGETHLFGSKYDTAVDALFQLVGVVDEFEVRDLAKSLGGAVVKKVYDWSQINYVAGYEVDITWTTSEGLKKGSMIGTETLGRLVDIIGRTSDTERRTFRAAGSLVGMDTKTTRFRFVEHDGDDYSGYLSDSFPATRQWSVNANYVAEIESETTTTYATMDKRVTFRLLNLHAPKATA